ncbi:hypothetical protein A5906_00605 [Bradyrhizobium sacchari]|uniref:Uncharacterized protein n=1 Tax=Bradyrhizobium sacchari TaxID=1399419 RepID=A0A560K7B9_9BRAD|nr:hypothetical protein [Bradyrhizobium sacchari]OPY96851.1 hypothetical protein A5906_00605 [Bradyrhizobium sacchari]TWB55554.1 hypothetical protein FBZ94_10770 [Bradyrhizobium sacchari]TWB79137.1 hypothetical protein FBZ95_103989 [Bradyrhizobium sacchari]
MRFILVNGRTPFRKTSCLWCCEEIEGGYLRDARTLLPYCGYECYAIHQDAARLIGERTRAAS